MKAALTRQQGQLQQGKVWWLTKMARSIRQLRQELWACDDNCNCDGDGDGYGDGNGVDNRTAKEQGNGNREGNGA